MLGLPFFRFTTKQGTSRMTPNARGAHEKKSIHRTTVKVLRDADRTRSETAKKHKMRSSKQWAGEALAGQSKPRKSAEIQLRSAYTTIPQNWTCHDCHPGFTGYGKSRILNRHHLVMLGRTLSNCPCKKARQGGLK